MKFISIYLVEFRSLLFIEQTSIFHLLDRQLFVSIIVCFFIVQMHFLSIASNLQYVNSKSQIKSSEIKSLYDCQQKLDTQNKFFRKGIKCNPKPKKSFLNFYFEVKFNPQIHLNNIKIKFLDRNFMPLTVKRRQNRNLVMRQMNSLNQYNSNYYFIINPYSGNLYIQYSQLYSLNQIKNLFYQTYDQFVINSDKVIANLIEVANQKIHKICLFGNILTGGIAQQQTSRKESVNIFVQIKKLNKLINSNLLQKKFQNIDQIQLIGMEDDTQMVKKTLNIHKLQKSNKNNANIALKINTNKINSDDIEKYSKYMIPKIYKSNRHNYILNNIKILNVEKIQFQDFFQGGFTNVKKAKVSFLYQQKIQSQNENYKPELIITRPIVLKQNIQDPYKLKNKRDRVHHQKNIIKLIGNLTFIHLPQYYQTNQIEFKNSLLMSYYTFNSLQHYQAFFQITQTLLTKIFILYQVAQGLKFIHSHGIIHLDLKPLNILIGKGIVARLCDFGQSYHKNVCDEQFYPGKTLPYTPYEIMEKKNIQFTQKQDVFSFGVMMHEIFFEQSIISYTNKDFGEKNINNIKIDYIGQIQGTNQLQQILNLLRLLCFKCVKFNPKNRPSIDWILIILGQCIRLLEEI